MTLAVVRKLCFVCALGAVALLAAPSGSRVAPALAAAGPACAGVPDDSTQTAPSPGQPCWVDADPYPFGTDGNPVDPTSTQCVLTPKSCYLVATSLAFRSWNRGLAATAGGKSNPFGVWLYNGIRWYPDPTFPGSGVCQGNTVLWAGKLDYWLIGTGKNGWAPLCRFDGSNFVWEPLPMPLGTVLRLGDPITGRLPPTGGITSGSCLAWDNCWFFGTDGTVLQWDGEGLTDVSPDTPAASADTSFTGAQLSAGGSGSAIGLAAVGTDYVSAVSARSPVPTGATMPTQLFAFDGTTAAGRRLPGRLLTPTPYRPPFAAEATELSGDPFGSDPIALSLDSSGRGWLAANPAAWRVNLGTPFLRPDLTADERSPLLPVSTGLGISTGADPSCPSWYTEDGLDRFPHVYPEAPGSTLWTSISTFPGGESALAGGQTYSTLSDGTLSPEPVLVQASCDGSSTVTRFRVPDPLGSGSLVPADESGWVEAVAANAPNDGWAATSAGIVPDPNGLITYAPPHLYRFTDGTPPEAPAGDDNETRALPADPDPPVYVYKPPPPPKLPPLPTGATTKHQPPAISGIRRSVKRGGGTYVLTLSFRVRRRVVLGLDAFRQKRMIASTGLKQFRPPSGQLQLHLNPKAWPTKLTFSSDTPQVALAVPRQRLSGDVALAATAKPISGRTIRSVEFQYELSGTDYWIVIGKVKKRPFRLPFDTSAVADGTYDLRAVATDNRGGTGISRVVAARVIKNARG